MPQPPRYERDKDFTLDFGSETDHSALNAEFDSAANSINDIRTNLAILQADDGNLRPSVVTPDSISENLRVSLIESVIIGAQDMLNQSQAAAASAEAAKADAASSSSTASSFAAVSVTKASEASASASQAAASAASVNAANLIHTTGNESKAGVLTLTDGLVTSSINGGQLAGLRNKIINGCCRIAQRTNVPAVNNVPTYGGCDRIFAWPSGWTTSSGTIGQGGNGATASSYSQGLQNFTSTGSGEICFGTRLEAKEARSLNGKTVTFSVLASHNLGANVSATIGLSKANSEDNFTAITHISESPTTLVQAFTWTRLKFILTLGASDASNGLQLYARFYGLSAMTNKGFFVGDWQLEEGSVRTPFEMRPVGLERMLCQRYARVGIDGAVGKFASATDAYVGIIFPMSMRAAPTVTHLSDYLLGEVGVNLRTVTATAVNTVSAAGATLLLTASGGTSPNMVVVGGNAFVLFSAEL